MTSKPDPRTVTVLQVRRAIAKRIVEGGSVRCPCCSKWARMRRGTISPSMARTILKAYESSPREAFQCRQVDARDHNGDYAKLRYWGLLKRAGKAGWWRLTPLGRAFARGDVEVPANALTYKARLYALVGDPVSITDCLGRSRDFDAMVSGSKLSAKS